MKRTVPFPALTAALVSAGLLTGGAALAADRDEVTQFRAAPHSITAAIAAAEKAAGGQAVAAEFDDDRNGGHYEVDVVAGDKLHEITIDASTGAVKKTEDKGTLANLDKDDAITPAQLGAPLAELVAKAEKASGEKVMAIGYEHEDGKPVGIEVELGKADGSSPSFLLDVASGTLTPYND